MISPNCILDNIKSNAEKDNLRVPKLKDLYNFLYTLNKKIVGKSSMTLSNGKSKSTDKEPKKKRKKTNDNRRKSRKC